MKIRHQKQKYEYVFWGKDRKDSKIFKKKADLIKYLNRIVERALNGEVGMRIDALGSSFTSRSWLVWYNEQKAEKHNIFEIQLKQLDFRGKKYIHKPHPIKKSRVKYFIFSDQIISLMCFIGNKKYTDSHLTNLLVLFYKRGFRDFELQDEYDIAYYNRDSHKSLETFNEWFYWSDRCDFTRTKVIHDLIKRERPEAFKKYLQKIKVV